MHIFLTGAKGVGKSTLLNAIAEGFPGAVGGFRTVRLNTYLPGQYSVHLLAVGKAQQPGAENLLFLCGRAGRDMASRFEDLGCRALRESSGAGLLVMDELGPHEEKALRFQQAVWKALDGALPVLGVLQQADSPFLKQIARHPKVWVIPITEENRAQWTARVPALVQVLRGNVHSADLYGFPIEKENSQNCPSLIHAKPY